jgi:uncharacterized protein YndB with AHSA1/START domain
MNMTVTGIARDPEALTLTFTVELDVPVERAWQLWADPRQLEAWWGPPGYPATFTDHDLRPGGLCRYHMTGPDGGRYHGGWEVRAAEAPRRVEVADFFAHDDGRPNPDLPVTEMTVDLHDLGDGRTRMVITSRFPSVEAMEQVLRMGAEEGMARALGQIEGLLRAA